MSDADVVAGKDNIVDPCLQQFFRASTGNITGGS